MTRSAKSQDLKAKKCNPDMVKDFINFRLDLVFVFLCSFVTIAKQIPGTELLRPLQYLQARPVPEGFQRRVILCHGHVWWTGSDHAMKHVMKVMEIDAWKELLKYKHGTHKCSFSGTVLVYCN